MPPPLALRSANALAFAMRMGPCPRLLVCVLAAAVAAGTPAGASRAAAARRHRREALAQMFEGMRSRRALNGEEACEGQGYNRNKCLQVGCCEFDGGACWSVVGKKTCGASGNSNNNGNSSNSGMMGGCILTQPAGAVPPTGPYTVAAQSSGVRAPFTKKVTAFGLGLVTGAPDAKTNKPNAASDAAMCAIAHALTAMFPAGAADHTAQKGVLEAMWTYKAVFPVIVGDGSEVDRAGYDDTVSMCDVFYVMPGNGEGQIMEVIEHLLHAITDVGLHYQYPQQWGISATSTLYTEMQKAIALGVYDVSDYDGMKGDTEAYNRVLLQEFAYFVITSAWDIQTAHGPNSKEWTARTPAQLKATLPGAWQLYKTTVAKIMAGPSAATISSLRNLDAFGLCPASRTTGPAAPVTTTAPATCSATCKKRARRGHRTLA